MCTRRTSARTSRHARGHAAVPACRLIRAHRQLARSCSCTPTACCLCAAQVSVCSCVLVHESDVRVRGGRAAAAARSTVTPCLMPALSIGAGCGRYLGRQSVQPVGQRGCVRPGSHLRRCLLHRQGVAVQEGLGGVAEAVRRSEGRGVGALAVSVSAGGTAPDE